MGALRNTYGFTVSCDLPLFVVYATYKWPYLVSLTQVLGIPHSQIQGNYKLEREAAEPDPHIGDLNGELTKCEGYVSTAVGERECACVSFAILLDPQLYISFLS